MNICNNIDCSLMKDDDNQMNLQSQVSRTYTHVIRFNEIIMMKKKLLIIDYQFFSPINQILSKSIKENQNEI